MTTITKSKPFYAVAGAGDLAVKTLRQGADRLSTLRLDRKDITSTINVIQTEARTIPYRAQNVAVVLVGETVGIADAVYGDLVNRGRSITNRIRRQKATQDLQAQTATTVRRTRTATTTAKKSASATGSAAKGAATRARKQAAATGKATRSAATSARKTAGTAAKATADAAEKVGTQ
jgi:heparin binding hemagglutinin HbhA